MGGGSDKREKSIFTVVNIVKELSAMKNHKWKESKRKEKNLNA